jgi:cell division inhibitor SulA/protein ImuA
MGRPPLEDIFEKLPVWRGGALCRALEAVPTGFAALDAELPGGGWSRQALTEVLSDAPGIGELGLILPAVAALTSAGKRVVCIAPPYVPYAPALAGSGIDLVNLLVIRPQNRPDALWAAQQVLRSGSCHALAAWLPRARYAELQRLCVAAEAGRALAFVFRPLGAMAESSPACLRLGLEPAGLEVGVHIVKRRGVPRAAPLYLRLERPFHVLGRAASSRPAGGHARVPRGLGLPVHA